MKEENAELKCQLTDRDEKLAAAEARDGSLFDLKHDSAEEIITVLVDQLSAHKAAAIANGNLKKLKQKRVPAG
jgi:hypothetical protein